MVNKLYFVHSDQFKNSRRGNIIRKDSKLFSKEDLVRWRMLNGQLKDKVQKTDEFCYGKIFDNHKKGFSTFSFNTENEHCKPSVYMECFMNKPMINLKVCSNCKRLTIRQENKEMQQCLREYQEEATKALTHESFKLKADLIKISANFQAEFIHAEQNRKVE
ncbi:hypothetical protein ACTFIW_007679 [Dictyostelium discoideum]